MNLNLFDTYLKKDISISLDHTIKMYSCGPTVYSYLHIGNVVAVLMPELIANTIKYSGGEVNWVLNVTDLGHLTDDGDNGEDKMEKGARKDSKTAKEVAEFYYSDFKVQLDRLNIDYPTGFNNPLASDYIYEQMYIALHLLKNKRAYIDEDGIYYDSSVNMDIDRSYLPKSNGSSEYTDRDIVNATKDPEDFALWKFVSESSLQKYRFEDFSLLRDLECPSEIKSLWGCPGWHTECVAMIGAVLGIGKNYKPNDFSFDQFKGKNIIDIHTGGEDHIEIHHKNEILQSLSLGFKLSKYWVHNRHLKVDNQKMSKSVGNSFNVEGDASKTGFDSIVGKGFNPLAFRLLFLEHSYQEQINFTWDKLAQSENRLFSIYKLAACIESLNSVEISTELQDIENKINPRYFVHNESEISNESNPVVEFNDELESKFETILLNQLNTREALELFQKILTDTVTNITKGEIDQKTVNSLFRIDSTIFKLNIFQPISQINHNLLLNRQEAKNNKNYQLSDEIRDELIANGYVVDDYKWGSGLWKKR